MGKQRITTKKEDRKIKRMALKNRFKTATDLSIEFNKIFKLDFLLDLPVKALVSHPDT